MYENEEIVDVTAEPTSPTDDIPEITGDPFLQGLGYDPENATDQPDHTGIDETANAEDQTDDKTEKTPPEEKAGEYEVTYKGKKQTVFRSHEELIRDIQKAMDYDAVRKERDDLRADAADAQRGLEVLDYYAEQNGMTRAEYIEFCNKTAGRGSEDAIMDAVMMEYPDIDEKAAKEIAAARLQAQQAKTAEAEEAKINAQLEELAAEYPDVKDMNSLPEAVKTAIGEGKTPLEAMRAYELAEARRKLSDAEGKISALEKQIKNRQTAPGRVDNNAPGEGYDPFLAGLRAGGE